MTKTSRFLLSMIVVTTVAWLGVACGPPSEPEPEATATVAAETDQGMAKQPIWKQCMKKEDDCITGVRVQVGTKNEDGRCRVFLRSWFAEPSNRIRVYSQGRVFFLVQWQEECKGMSVRLTHTDEQHPWENQCHEGPWKQPDDESYRLVPCEVLEHSEQGQQDEQDNGDDKDSWTEYPFSLQLEETPEDKTGGTVRVRGSGRPPSDDAPAP